MAYRNLLPTVKDGNYQGEWQNDKRHGQGYIRYGNRESYNGEWLNDHKHGRGDYSYTNGNFYSGEFEADVRTGDFIENGLSSGRGMLIYENGSVYSGEWLNGHRSGQGTFTAATKGLDSVYRCLCKNDIYSGSWLNDKMHGHYVMTCILSRGLRANIMVRVMG
eukprot:gene28895-35845_t